MKKGILRIWLPLLVIGGIAASYLVYLKYLQEHPYVNVRRTVKVTNNAGMRKIKNKIIALEKANGFSIEQRNVDIESTSTHRLDFYQIEYAKQDNLEAMFYIANGDAAGDRDCMVLEFSIPRLQTDLIKDLTIKLDTVMRSIPVDDGTVYSDSFCGGFEITDSVGGE